jgi:RNA polymerase sigma-70 factor (ECF subfamily)
MKTRRLVQAPDEDSPELVGPPSSFEELFESERTRLFRALCLLTGNRNEAEELAQDAFVRVWERWDRVASMEDPAGYLYRTAMNGFRSRYRRSLVALRVSLSAPAPDAFREVEDREAVVRRLARLTRKQRAAVVLLDLLDFTSEEAGQILGMQPGAVRTQASRGRAELRRMEGDRDA